MKMSDEFKKSIKGKGHRFCCGDNNLSKRPEVRKKMSETRRQNYKDGKWRIGYNHSDATKRKIGVANKGNKHTEEAKLKMSISRSGARNSQWRGGKSFEPYTTDWTETLRRSIRERDNYICQICSQYGNTVHHIDYDKKNCNPDNLITLCCSCHTKTSHKRKYWTNYFLTNLGFIE